MFMPIRDILLSTSQGFQLLNIWQRGKSSFADEQVRSPVEKCSLRAGTVICSPTRSSRFFVSEDSLIASVYGVVSISSQTAISCSSCMSRISAKRSRKISTIFWSAILISFVLLTDTHAPYRTEVLEWPKINLRQVLSVYLNGLCSCFKKVRKAFGFEFKAHLMSRVVICFFCWFANVYFLSNLWKKPIFRYLFRIFKYYP